MRAKSGIPEVDKALIEVWRAVDNTSGGVYLPATLAAGVPHRLAHGLNRPWKRWMLTRTTSTSPVFEVQVATTNRLKEIWLQSASAGDIEIFLF